MSRLAVLDNFNYYHIKDDTLQEILSYRMTTPEREARLMPPAPGDEPLQYIRLANPITSERSVPAIVSALNTLFSNYPNRHATRRHAEHFSWETTTMGQLQLFSDIVQKGLRNA